MFAVLTSAILFSLAFPNAFSKFGFGWIAWFALIPLFFGLQNTMLVRRIWLGFVFGVVIYGLILQWLWSVHMAGTMLFVLILSVQPLIFSLFYFYRSHSFLNSVYVPSLWVVSEWLRTVFLKGFCFSLGYSQAFSPQLAQLASLGGSYAVAFVIIWANYCLYSAIRFPDKRKFYVGAALIVFVLNVCYGAWTIIETPAQPAVVVAGVQPNIKPHDKLSADLYEANIETHIALTNSVLQSGKADLIVWPETAFPWDVLQDPLWHGRISQLAINAKSFLMLGAATFQDGKNYNSAVLFAPSGQLNGVDHKNHLVPLCEYCPVNKASQWIKRLSRLTDFDFTAGRAKSLFSMQSEGLGSTDFGVLICSESCYPGAARGLSKIGANFIIVMLNDGWFKKPEAMMIHAQNAIMRAIECGRDVMSVANTGWTFRSDFHGIVNSSLSLQQPQSGAFPVAPRKNQTLYVRIGDIFAAVCLLFVIIILLLRNKIYKSS